MANPGEAFPCFYPGSCKAAAHIRSRSGLAFSDLLTQILCTHSRT